MIDEFNAKLKSRLESLWEDIECKRKELDDATHELIKAYADHKSGESYKRCDIALKRCNAIGWQYSELRSEYDKLCGEIILK